MTTLDFCIVITRTSDNGTVTLGNLVARNGDDVFECKTLELPWKQNESRISCIPTGVYSCSKTVSPSRGLCIAIHNVPERYYILIHKGNFLSDTKGCVLVGDKHLDFTGDSIADIINSKVTLDKLMAMLPTKFMLEIV